MILIFEVIKSKEVRECILQGHLFPLISKFSCISLKSHIDVLMSTFTLSVLCCAVKKWFDVRASVTEIQLAVAADPPKKPYRATFLHIQLIFSFNCFIDEFMFFA